MARTLIDCRDEILKRAGIYVDSADPTTDTYFPNRAIEHFLDAMNSLALAKNENGDRVIPVENYQPMIVAEDYTLSYIEDYQKLNFLTVISGFTKNVIDFIAVENSYTQGAFVNMRLIQVDLKKGMEYYHSSMFKPEKDIEVLYWIDDKSITFYHNLVKDYIVELQYLTSITNVTDYNTSDLVSTLHFTLFFIDSAIDMAVTKLKAEWEGR